MAKNTLNKIEKLANIAIMAADEYDKLQHLNSVDFITETANLRSFFNVLTSDIVDSITDVMGDTAMEYLKNSNKYLREGIRRLDGSVVGGTPTVETIDAIKDITIKGLVSYILYAIALVGELRDTVDNLSEDILDTHRDLYGNAMAALDELKEIVDELDLIGKYTQLNYLEEFNIEESFGDVESGVDVDDNTASSILNWSEGKGDAIDFSNFEEE